MLELILAFFLAFCPNHHKKSNHDNGTQVTTMDTGGETEHGPNQPPPPPPPPTNP